MVLACFGLHCPQRAQVEVLAWVAISEANCIYRALQVGLQNLLFCYFPVVQALPRRETYFIELRDSKRRKNES